MIILFSVKLRSFQQNYFFVIVRVHHQTKPKELKESSTIAKLKEQP
jgi:hypothetical protein